MIRKYFLPVLPIFAIMPILPLFTFATTNIQVSRPKITVIVKPIETHIDPLDLQIDESIMEGRRLKNNNACQNVEIAGLLIEAKK